MATSTTLWLLETTPKLAIIPRIEIEKHIPVERGKGIWKETIIPFSAFSDYFITVK